MYLSKQNDWYQIDRQKDPDSIKFTALQLFLLNLKWTNEHQAYMYQYSNGKEILNPTWNHFD